MQLASHGARAVARKAPPTTARSIHIPSAIRPQATNLGQRLLSQTRNALTRFVTHLTTPGTGTVSVARSFHAANPSIQQRLSFAARTTLARPLHGGQFLPRAPVVPRGMTQVGLGTARNFSSSRPIFQQLADNVPIAGRALYEADWELSLRREQENMRRPAKKAAALAQSKEMLKPTSAKKSAKKAQAASPAAELEHYFPAPVPTVTTHLLIPLAPSPTGRTPLSEFPASSSTGRLPLPAFLALHDTHATHALRVASLFQRLDAADVWARGAACATYASSSSSACTVLKVEFAGWSAQAVRGVIGESGTGWCVLEEAATADPDDGCADADDAFSETSSVLSGLDEGHFGLEAPAHAVDPAHALVLPTLDFSATFRASEAWRAADADAPAFVDPPSENGWFESRVENPWLSDSDSGAEDGWLDAPAPSASRRSSESWHSGSEDGWAPASERSWLGFSSAFAGRLAEPEPLESPFA